MMLCAIRGKDASRRRVAWSALWLLVCTSCQTPTICSSDETLQQERPARIVILSGATKDDLVRMLGPERDGFIEARSALYIATFPELRLEGIAIAGDAINLFVGPRGERAEIRASFQTGVPGGAVQECEVVFLETREVGYMDFVRHRPAYLGTEILPR